MENNEPPSDEPEDQKADDRGLFTDPHHVRGDMMMVISAMKSGYGIDDSMRKLATEAAVDLMKSKKERTCATGVRAFAEIERLSMEREERLRKAAKEAGNEAGRSIFEIAAEQADAMDLTILAPGAIRANGRHNGNGKANGNGKSNGNGHAH